MSCGTWVHLSSVFSVSHSPDGDKSGPSGSHQLSKGVQLKSQGWLIWWREGHILIPKPIIKPGGSNHVLRSEQGLPCLPKGRHGPLGVHLYLSPPPLPSLAQPVPK